VLPGDQKQGIGQALYTRLADDLRHLGARSLRVWVLTANHAGRAFYSALGGEEQHTETFRLAGQTLHKTAYVWPDISVRRR